MYVNYSGAIMHEPLIGYSIGNHFIILRYRKIDNIGFYRKYRISETRHAYTKLIY